MTQSSCIIVGFGSGIRFALAKAFGREGFALALIVRDPDRHSILLNAPLLRSTLARVSSRNFWSAGTRSRLSFATLPSFRLRLG